MTLHLPVHHSPTPGTNPEWEPGLGRDPMECNTNTTSSELDHPVDSFHTNINIGEAEMFHYSLREPIRKSEFWN